MRSRHTLRLDAQMCGLWLTLWLTRVPIPLPSPSNPAPIPLQSRSHPPAIPLPSRSHPAPIPLQSRSRQNLGQLMLEGTAGMGAQYERDPDPVHTAVRLFERGACAGSNPLDLRAGSKVGHHPTTIPPPQLAPPQLTPPQLAGSARVRARARLSIRRLGQAGARTNP